MLEAFAVAFGLIFLAELGDKSQLLALGLATRYPPLVVLTAVVLGTLVIEGVAVAVGAAFATVLPTEAIAIAAGFAFMGFAWWTLRADDEIEEAAAPRPGRWTVLALAGAFVVAEIGDKTQLLTLTLASTNDPLATWLGTSAGMIAVSGLAVFAGAALGTRLPRRTIRLLSAAAFAVFGVLLLADGVGIM